MCLSQRQVTPSEARCPSKALTRNLEHEDEFLLDAQEPSALEAQVLAPQTKYDESDAMAIDEEGRPRFAPTRDIVRKVSVTDDHGG